MRVAKSGEAAPSGTRGVGAPANNASLPPKKSPDYKCDHEALYPIHSARADAAAGGDDSALTAMRFAIHGREVSVPKLAAVAAAGGGGAHAAD